MWKIKKIIKAYGSLVAQSVECPSLDSGSGRDPRVMGQSPALSNPPPPTHPFQALCSVGSLLLSPSLCPSPHHTHICFPLKLWKRKWKSLSYKQKTNPGNNNSITAYSIHRIIKCTWEKYVSYLYRDFIARCCRYTSHEITSNKGSNNHRSLAWRLLLKWVPIKMQWCQNHWHLANFSSIP